MAPVRLYEAMIAETPGAMHVSYTYVQARTEREAYRKVQILYPGWVIRTLAEAP